MRWLGAAVVLAVVAAIVAGDGYAGRSTRPPAPTGPADLSVQLRRDVTEAQKQEIGDQLAALPEVRAVRFQSREEAHRRFLEQFPHLPALAESVKPESMSESWLVYLAAGGTCAAVTARVRDLSGVDQVFCGVPQPAVPSPTR